MLGYASVQRWQLQCTIDTHNFPAQYKAPLEMGHAADNLPPCVCLMRVHVLFVRRCVRLSSTLLSWHSWWWPMVVWGLWWSTAMTAVETTGGVRHSRRLLCVMGRSNGQFIGHLATFQYTQRGMQPGLMAALLAAACSMLPAKGFCAWPKQISATFHLCQVNDR